ncbi:MAG: hypothetical protein ABIO45_18550, partial [Burkholderiaceae bacterium]
MQTIAIFGSSGYARELDDIAHALGCRTLFVARDAAERAAWRGDGELVVEAETGRYAALPCALGIAEPALRERVAQAHLSLQFVNLVHPLASFGRGQRDAVESRRGIAINAGVRFMSRIKVGDF